MCLHVLKKTCPPNDNIISGYKVYERTKKCYRDIHRGGIRRMGFHYKANSGFLNALHNDICQDIAYHNGFHVYTSLSHAEIMSSFNSVICKVLAWDIRAKGKEGFADVIVAKNLRIIEEIN